ncbi:MAG TPA: DCC1-like thiol-disulfide oxidoreductase family protein [Solirubrobacterales bacterium]|nr:DCC1-like thiol-disulfide oxidoreductase family protein [Solirubrobacterales bacterium]
MKIFYDGACGFCKVCVALLIRWDRDGCLDPIAIQDPEGQRLLAPIPAPERLDSAHLMTASGEILSGAEGAPELLRQLPGGRPLAALLALAMPLTRLVYRLVTAARPAIGSILPATWGRWATRLIAERRHGTTLPTASL